VNSEKRRQERSNPRDLYFNPQGTAALGFRITYSEGEDGAFRSVE